MATIEVTHEAKVWDWPLQSNEGVVKSRSDEHGTVAREVHRAYKLPPDVDVTTVKSHLTNRGVLNITASKVGK
ncbi:hypothetical protein ANCCEY_03943 [Ancylostoma ceylanicum]|uniref:SHSP domain-containing protein n=1 Tax=Ancylostoma ceylanicum TaxID=53326 RepID=A0A0D6LY51_9BILA|nr:hypothetical protein ANCCEY_03943 [Ancylostoma ceylanicum]